MSSANAGLERELKWTVYDVQSELDTLPELIQHGLRILPAEQQENSYFDTPSRVFSKLGYALRLRRIGERFVLTFKGASVQDGALVVREEEEHECSDQAKQRFLRQKEPLEIKVLLEDVPFGKRILERIAGERLELLARFQTERARYQLDVGELDFDHVRVRLGSGALVELRELELELLPTADKQSIDEVVRALQTHIALVPSSKNKLEWALEAERTRLHSGMAWSDAARVILSDELQRLRAFQPMAQAGVDPEGVHGMRVAVRRLRSALRLFNKVIVPAQAKMLHGDLKWLAKLLGEVRDLDVGRSLLVRWGERVHAKHPNDAKALLPAHSILDRAREEAQLQLQAVLAGARYARLLTRFERLRLEKDAAQTLSDEVPEMLGALWHRLGKHGRKAMDAEASLGDVHELRKTVKRVRYVSEFLAPVLKSFDQEREFKELQEQFGQLNDKAVWMQRLPQLVHHVPVPTAFALGQFEEHLRRSLKKTRRRLKKLWKASDLANEKHITGFASIKDKP